MIAGGFKVGDADGQSLAYVYSRKNPNDAHIAKVLTEDDARRIASNIAKLPTLLGKEGWWPPHGVRVALAQLVAMRGDAWTAGYVETSAALHEVRLALMPQ
jgi:hypothetical protein